MRYRMEVMEDKPVIRNVETDVVLGRVAGSGYDAKDPDLKAKFDAVLWDRQEITVFPRQPLEHALLVIAGREARSGYPGLKKCEAKPDPMRIEFALGNLMADAVSKLALGLVEYRNGGLQQATKGKLADLIVEIFHIRWASAFGSYNGETRQNEPYFVNVSSKQRMTFDAAAQHYGMNELGIRFHDVSEAIMQELLSSVIDIVKQVTDPEMPIGARRCPG